MNLTTARRLDRWIGAPLCALLSLLHRLRTGIRRKSADRRSILFIQISEMGSILLVYPMIAELEKRHPGATLHFLTFGKNRDCLELLGRIPASNVVPLEHRSLLGFCRSALSAVIRLRRARIDTVIDLELFSRISAIFAAVCGAAQRAGFHRHCQEGLYRGSFWTHPVLYSPYLHMSRNFANLLEALEAAPGRPLVKTEAGEPPVRLPRLPSDDNRRRRARQLLADSCPHLPTEPIIVLLNPGAGELPIRAWPLENYVELAGRLLRRDEIVIGVIGLADDQRFYSDMAARIGADRLFDLTGRTPHVLDLIEVFNACHVLVTADGGPAHFASLSSIHAVVFFGPETPALYGPLGDNHTCLFAAIACSPCLTAYNHRQTPCDGNNVCVQRFSPAQVEAIVLERLGIRP